MNIPTKLSQEETQIIEIIRRGNASSVEVLLRNGQPSYIIITHERLMFKEARIEEYLDKHGYQTLIFKTQSGRATYGCIKTRIKFGV